MTKHTSLFFLKYLTGINKKLRKRQTFIFKFSNNQTQYGRFKNKLEQHRKVFLTVHLEVNVIERSSNSLMLITFVFLWIVATKKLGKCKKINQINKKKGKSEKINKGEGNGEL